MKTVIVLGTWSSGSGAVSDYLSSRKEFYNPFGVNEFKIISDPMGLHYLFKNCYFQKDLLNPSHVFEEYKKYISNIQSYPVFSSYGKKKLLYDKSINTLTNKFLNDITLIKYYGLPHYKSLSLDFDKKLFLKFRRKLSSKSIPDLKVLPIITPVNANKFIKKAREYILNIIKTSSKVKIKNKIILLNNGADICDPLTSSQYYYNPKIICVTRDPRDIYCGMKSRQAGSTPWYDVKIFVKWYKYYFGNKDFKKKLKNKSILTIKFENFINNFEQENRKICKFLNIKEKVEFDKKNQKIFNINLSKKNIYKSKKLISKKDFNFIESSLKEYLQW